MSKLTRIVRISIALGLLVLLLAVSTFTFTPSKAFAATTQASTGHSITSAKISSSSMQPDCGTSVSWYQWPAYVQKGTSYTYGASWACAGNNTQTWIIDWRDGYTSSYTCYPIGSSCVSGSFTGNHTYTTAGTFIIKVYNSYNSAIASWVTITVH
jgi:hypothetical protein